jgi:hypothetical protein
VARFAVELRAHLNVEWVKDRGPHHGDENAGLVASPLIRGG